MNEDLFTQSPEPNPPKKRLFEDVWEEYRAKRDKVISEQFYNGKPIIDK